MEHFAGYGFNKSHSTTYAYLAYQTAYLKANYPWHFESALLTIEAQNTDKVAMYLGESPRPRHPGAAAGHQRKRVAVHRHAGRRPVWPDGDQECGRGRHRVDAGGREARGGRLRDAQRALRRPRPPAGEQARARSAREGRARWTRSRRPCRSGSSRRPLRVVAAAADGGARCRGRAWRARPARQASSARRTCSAARACRGRGRDAQSCHAARGAGVDRDGAAQLREGGARPVLERASGRCAHRGPAGGRRPDDRRAAGNRGGRRAPSRPRTAGSGQAHGAQRRGRRRRRHHLRRPAAEDAQGRSDGGRHDRGLPWQSRGRGVSRDVQGVPPR